MEKQAGKRCLPRVVLVPCPFQGHINPMLQLGILHSNGFSITVAHTQYNSPDPSNHPNFSFIPLMLAELMRQQEGLACIIDYELMYFSEATAMNLKLPTIVLRTISAAAFLAHIALINLKAEGHIPFPESRSHESVLEFYPLRFKDLPISTFGKLENSLQLVSEVANNRRASAIIYNTIGYLENS
ncbi:hypothetical protein FH972_011615 [Carpinus fangiana]|uniref:Uncharacterized protein n=1 Tax=Carpinus fangiana TaxID=176857 RepID=A0A660KRW9_9ROSI|nr:hypothetical protein FH972_011615 [Carpinus fangiana]